MKNDDASSIHSNAFNFLSYVDTGVDPRTGMFTCTISLPELHANNLRGPAVPISLAHNPLQSDDLGLGRGWSLRLSSYDGQSRTLTLSTGDTYKAADTGTELLVMDKKLDTFRVAKREGDFWITHKSGLVEILSNENGFLSTALPKQIISPEGRSIYLDYEFYNGERYLSQVRDEMRDKTRRLLTVQRDRGGVVVTQWPDEAAPVVFMLVLEDDLVTKIQLPVANEPSWRLKYDPEDPRLIERIYSPSGGMELVHYSQADDGHQVPPGGPVNRLRYAIGHEVFPGNGQPSFRKDYRYSSENFLGFGALSSWSNDGDNLYLVQGNYEYSSTESLWDVEARRYLRHVIRTYNRFHLMTREETERDDCIKLVETRYYERFEQPFEKQDAYCQLPEQVTTSFYQKSSPAERRCEVVSTEFDDYGNLLRQTDARGMVEEYSYYSPDGEPGCPADPLGFMRFVKQKTVIPAPTPKHLSIAAPTSVTRYRYVAQTSLIGGAPDHIVQSQEQLYEIEAAGEVLRVQTDLDYVSEASDRLHYGRLKTEIVTQNGQARRIGHSYQLDGGILSDTLTVTGFDSASRSWVDRRSTFNGLQTMVSDASGTTVAYEYDALGRVVTEITAPGTDDEAARRYTYGLAAKDDDLVYREVINANGVVSRIWYDGLKREHRIETQDADQPGKPERLVYEASYDTLGQLSKETRTDWLDGAPLRLTTIFHYDNWGGRKRTEYNEYKDGSGEPSIYLTEHHELDPIALSETTWLEGADGTVSGKTVTVSNLFEKPVSIERFDRNGMPAGKTNYEYDGLGRCVRETNPLDQVTGYEYDLFGRLIKNILPDGTLVERAYASHSREELPIELWVKDADWPTRVSAGQQTFDGLERLVSRTVGGRSHTFQYRGGLLQPESEHTPAHAVIRYEYNPQLTQQATRRTVAGHDERYAYDPKHAQLASTDEAGSGERHELEYFLSGFLKHEKWTRKMDSAIDEQVSYTYSLTGRPLTYTDRFERIQRNHYDARGRLERIELKLGENIVLTARCTYDTLGRLQQSVAQDEAGGRSLTTALQYDDFGREVTRILTVNGQTPQILAQRFTLTDKLAGRTLTTGEIVVRDERYNYDARGRLIDYVCDGIRPARDPYGQAIHSQRYDYDAWDNIVTLTTGFEGGEDIARYSYDNPNDPAQLTGISHSHPDYPALVTLHYDADGNLVEDEQARTLQYDALGRLTQISQGVRDALAHYRYDPLDQLVAFEQTGQPAIRRTYRSNQLVSEVQGSTQRSYVHEGELLLGQCEYDPSLRITLYATDQQQSVLHAVTDHDQHELAYSPYGYRSADAGLLGLLGFNGEPLERVTGGYLLGNGYRLYSPVLMRFGSPDSLSPFDGGGLNPYAYCLGDPINQIDPTGHLSWGAIVGIAIGAIGVVVSVASLGLATPVGAALIAAAPALVAPALAGLAASGVSGGLMAAAGGVSAVFGIAASATEANAETSKWLGLASAAFGLVSVSSALKTSASAIASTVSTSSRFAEGVRGMSMATRLWAGATAVSTVGGAVLGGVAPFVDGKAGDILGKVSVGLTAASVVSGMGLSTSTGRGAGQAGVAERRASNPPTIAGERPSRVPGGSQDIPLQIVGFQQRGSNEVGNVAHAVREVTPSCFAAIRGAWQRRGST